MKKILIATAYCGLLGFTIVLNSCQDDPIVPNSPNNPVIDTTWTIGCEGGDPMDSTFCGGGTPSDSTFNDPTGGGNPGDTLTDPTGGGNPNDSIGG